MHLTSPSSEDENTSAYLTGSWRGLGEATCKETAWCPAQRRHLSVVVMLHPTSSSWQPCQGRDLPSGGRKPQRRRPACPEPHSTSVAQPALRPALAGSPLSNCLCPNRALLHTAHSRHPSATSQLPLPDNTIITIFTLAELLAHANPSG